MTLDVAILGATGAVGQRFARLLHDHPTFQVTELVGHSSAGKTYRDTPWFLDDERPAALADLQVIDADAITAPVVMSAIPGRDAGPLESRLAKAGHAVFTNASPHRMDADVPLSIPDINPDHLAMVEGRDGFIVANPNCSSVAVTSILKPLHDAFGVEAVLCTTMQALSGAGYPGVPSLDSSVNVIPLIGGEEEKIETEPCKILGTLDGDRIDPAPVRISATATRVPTIEGHTVSLAVRLAGRPEPAAVVEALRSYRPADPGVLALPTACDPVIHVFDEPDRPQPRRDAMRGGGMQVTVGRVRDDPVFDGIKMVGLCSNTVRGAAGCSVLNAELAHARGII